MSQPIEGLGIELAELSVVGALLLAIVPAYMWVGKAPDQKSMFERSAIAGTALLTGAIAYGYSKR